jgi:hypothetical protein
MDAIFSELIPSFQVFLLRCKNKCEIIRALLGEVEECVLKSDTIKVL